MQLNGWNVDAGVVRRFAELAGPTVEWLGDLGVEFYDTLVFGGEERVPRVTCPIGRGRPWSTSSPGTAGTPKSTSPSASESTAADRRRRGRRVASATTTITAARS